MSRSSMIGMAMPPALAEAVARSVRAQLEAPRPVHDFHEGAVPVSGWWTP